jgi:predicted nucleotidyltransferase
LKRAKSVNILNYKVKFSSCEDLIIHKIFAGRERDLEDARIIIEKISIKSTKSILENG